MSEEMIKRFHMARWSPVRKAIYAMKPGTSQTFDIDDYYNINSSVSRLNDALGDKVWAHTIHGEVINVTRKP